MLLWTLMASSQIQMRKEVGGWETLAQRIAPINLDLALCSGPNSLARRTLPQNFHQIHTPSYHAERLHSTLDYLSPKEHGNQYDRPPVKTVA